MIAQQRRDLALMVRNLQKAVNDQNDYNDNEVGAIMRTLKLKEAKSEFDGLYEDLESSKNVLEKFKVIEEELICKLDEVRAERANVPWRVLH